MTNEKVFALSTKKVMTCLIEKAQRKSRTKEEVYEIIHWLTGYPVNELDSIISSTNTYKEFFDNAPQMNPNRTKITGSICGIKIQEIENPLMRDIRYLDKLVDELAKGKPMDKILEY